MDLRFVQSITLIVAVLGCVGCVVWGRAHRHYWLYAVPMFGFWLHNVIFYAVVLALNPPIGVVWITAWSAARTLHMVITPLMYLLLMPPIRQRP